MQYLFGYGSLISAESLSKTIGRVVQSEDLLEACLPAYIKNWGALRDVAVGDRQMKISASFLNIVPARESECWGVVIEVTGAELAALDARELRYHRERIEVIADGENIEAVTFVSDQDRPAEIVMAGYLEIIRRGLNLRSAAFSKNFWQLKRPTPEKICEGRYLFL